MIVREEITKEIINGYRERYQYQNIKRHYEIPETVNEETFLQLRNFYLDYIYPEFEKRSELEKAFRSLDDYIKQPQKLIGLLVDASKVILKYGRHLPKILNAGLKALKSFRAASKFENTLVQEAIKNKIRPPYDLSKIDGLMKYLSREEIEEFITTSTSLFETLHDKILTNKIIAIIEHLITVMRKKEESFTVSQIKGLEYGLQVLKEGNTLFNSLSEENQVRLIALITQIERNRLNQIS